MGLLYHRRVPEPEIMDEDEEVGAYASAVAAEHLDRLDSICAEAIVKMDARPGWWLDVGCGPGQIAQKVTAQTPARIVGTDLALNMLRQARESIRTADLQNRIFLVQADASALPFREGVFDLVYSNSVLHHLSDPAVFFQETARVMQRGGVFFLRDLVRPFRWRMRKHLQFYGRNYSGQMRRLFEASVRAAYTVKEARHVLQATALRSATLSREGDCYLVIRHRKSECRIPNDK
jgi:ubiquinone/menaquinone biosynthesis C-methylase UbiE